MRNFMRHKTTGRLDRGAQKKDKRLMPADAPLEAAGSSRVISKERVADHGEVLTGEREVKAMLDLVRQETERIDSRFLEPACGDGNFLVEILARKLAIVKKRYRKGQSDYERNALVALGSLYGIDILADNAKKCRQRLLSIFEAEYSAIFKSKIRTAVNKAAAFILGRNIVHGNALTLTTEGPSLRPIVFSEWSAINGSLIKRRDFAFSELVHLDKVVPDDSGELFAQVSDLGTTAFIPQAVQDFPLCHFLKLPDAKPSH